MFGRSVASSGVVSASGTESRRAVGFEGDPGGLLAASDSGDGLIIAFGVEQVHGLIGEAAPVAGLPLSLCVKPRLGRGV